MDINFRNCEESWKEITASVQRKSQPCHAPNLGTN